MIDVPQALSVILILGVTLVVAWRLAPYIARIYIRSPSRLDGLLNPIENAVYKLLGTDPTRGMGWKEYFVAGLLLNVAQMVLAFLILTFQGSKPLRSQDLATDVASPARLLAVSVSIMTRSPFTYPKTL